LKHAHNVENEAKETRVDDPESVKHIVGGLDVVGKRLEQFANHLVLLYNLYPLQKKWEMSNHRCLA